MATSTYLSNPVVKIGAVDISDQCTSAVVHQKTTALDSTAFGATAMVNVAGLQDNSIDLELYWSTAASETYATLKSLIGTSVNVTVQGSSAATSATNPLGTLTGGYLEEIPVEYKVGELSKVSITFKGGTFAWSES